MDPLLLSVLFGALTGGFIQGLSGFAFALVAMAVWAWTMPPQLAVPLAVFGSLLCQAASFGTVRHAFNLRRTLPFLAGGAIGVPIGTWLLPQIDEVAFKAAVGALLVLWCPAMLLAARLLPAPGGATPPDDGGDATRGKAITLADGGVGMVGGIMGGLGGLTGPAPILWCLLRGWDKDSQRAVFQTFNLVMQGLSLSIYAMGGTLTSAHLRLFAVLAPAMLVPNMLGARLYNRMDERAFRRMVLLVLLITGVTLLAKTVPTLLAR